MAFNGNEPINSKIIVYNIKVSQVNEFNFLGNYVSQRDEIDLGKKIERFNYISGIIYRNLKNKVRKDTLVKFYKTMAISSLLYSNENGTLTGTNEKKESKEQR